MKQIYLPILLLVACTDKGASPDTLPGENLVGDSNVYNNLEFGSASYEDQVNEGGEDSGAQPALLALDATLEGDLIHVAHYLISAPCEHDWAEHMSLEIPNSFHLHIDYGYEQPDNCIVELKYVINPEGLELEPGIYELTAADDKTEIDLSSL